MKSHSFFTKLLLGNLLLIVILVAVGGLVSFSRINRDYLVEREADQRRTTRMAARFLELIWADTGGAVERIDRECKRLLVEPPMRLTVIAADGRVLGDSEADPAAMENHGTPDRPEITEAVAGRSGRHERRSETLGVQYRYLADPICHGGRVVGVVRVAMPVVAIVRSQDFIRKGLLWAALAAVVVAGVLAALLSWLWYAPLREIAHTARTLAGGDLSQRAAISGSGELRQLARALNEMRNSLSAHIEQIAAQRENLAMIVENLREGVIGLDGKGQILLMNDAARGLLATGDGQVVGEPFQTFVRIAQVVDVYNEAATGKRPVGRQIEADIAGRRCVLDVHALRLAESAPERLAVLLVVRDVTELVRMASVKAEFVANASHELRTPLATIRAAVDSLASVEGPVDDQTARLAVILDRHTRRLEEMTSDLLSLHRVESSRHTLRPEPIEPAGLTGWVRDNYAEQAEQKGVCLAASCPEQLAPFTADATLIELILQNLLDNAIKFTPPGGEVSCRIDAEGPGVAIRVRDTGCGIPPEMQDRVFERFFQADTARSGEPRVRGTGLGLAIVRHAAERLGASVDLQSTPGKGTTVTVTVPPREKP